MLTEGPLGGNGRNSEEVLEPLCAVHSSIDLYRKGITLQGETGFSYYDALILTAALDGGCQILYSEDLQLLGRASHLIQTRKSCQ